MAFNLPAFVLNASKPSLLPLPVLDASQVASKLPLPVLDASQVQSKLPLPVLDGSRVSSGLTLPTFELTEAGQSTFSYTGNIGLNIGLNSEIVGQPIIGDLGLKVGLNSQVTQANLTPFSYQGMMGVKVGLNSPVTNNAIRQDSKLSLIVGLRSPFTSYHAPQIYEETALASTVRFGASAIASKVMDVTTQPSTFGSSVRAIANRSYDVVAGNSTVKFSASASSQKIVNEVATSTVKFSVSALANGIFNATLPTSTVRFRAGAQLVSQFIDGWAYNLNTKAPSSYENFDFNSFAKIGDKYYGLAADGLHLLDGETDNGDEINAVITTGKVDFDDPRTKKIPLVYVGAQTSEQMLLAARVDNEDEYTYEFTSDAENIAPTRVKLGRGLAGRYWQFELKNQDGADFEIDAIDIPVLPDTRRI